MQHLADKIGAAQKMDLNNLIALQNKKCQKHDLYQDPCTNDIFCRQRYEKYLNLQRRQRKRKNQLMA